jgi:hypothetical protein
VWNRSLADRGISPLSDAEVVEIAVKDIESRGYQDWHGGPSVARTEHTRIMKLLEMNPADGAHAFTMLMTLRVHHAARCERGETFAITPKAMATASTLPGFTRVRIESCRDMLLRAGFIELVKSREAGAKRKSAQFRLRKFRG